MKKLAAALCALLCLLAPAALALEITGLETETVTREWETSLFFSRMEALTGIAVQAHAVYEQEDYDKLLADMEKGSISADALFKAGLTREQEIRLIDAGAIIDLAPLIEENMPNLSALLEAHPQWREVIALEDGRIASLPLINESERQVIVWINRTWLEALGMDLPQNPGELTQALSAMTGADLNGNGKHDEIAADIMGVFEMRWLLPYFGIIADDYNLARGEDGSLVFAPELPAYRDFIAMLADWVDQGILTADAFTGTHSTAALSASGSDEAVKSGLIISPAPYTSAPIDSTLDYEALLMPGPDGETRWRDFLGEIWTGCFAVTSACEDPGEALRWLDALYAPEGATLAYAGVEGEDYSVDGEGRWAFITDGVRTVDDIRSESLMYTGSAMPGLTPTSFLLRVDSEIDVHVLKTDLRVKAVAEQVTLPYALGREAQARASELALTLGRLVDEGIARFATGEMALTDDHYEAWLSELREAGSEELVALFSGC